MGTVPPAVRPVPAREDSDKPVAQARPAPNTMTRITLALLDEYSGEHSKRGYNPYDRATPSPRQRAEDVWRRKPKRD
jgi:hypothetical protein